MKLEDKIDLVIKMVVFVGLINLTFMVVMFARTLELLEILLGGK